LNSEQAEIIRRARDGDLDALRLLHQEYGKRILNFIFRMVGSREDAEDLAQNVFLLAFNKLRGLQDESRFESWLYRIARNEVYQAFRKKKSEPAILEPKEEREDDAPAFEFTDARPTPQEKVLNEELGRTIHRVLTSLPPKLREVFILAVIYEKSYSEISEIVGRSLLSVKTDIFRARSLAREHLGRYLTVNK
jgi:RNA polymerase sigma-70 factor, ECF subfamily